MMQPVENLEARADELVDLASERLGGAVLYANDEFFASKDNLLRTAPPVFLEGKYTDRGKWMDGWETRRRRTPGHDFCLIRLGLPGLLRIVVVDTTHFRGNFPQSCSIDACAARGHASPQELLSADTHWTEVLPRSPLRGDSRNGFAIDEARGGMRRFTHLRLNIYPDGGVARLRVYGEVVPDSRWLRRGEVDLAAIENGGRVIGCSDMFFGSRHNLILPGPSLHMGDGWETRRSRGEGPDWVVVRLAAQGIIHTVEVDTAHFKGNAPDSCALAGMDALAHPGADPLAADAPYGEILPRTPLVPHTRHLFEQELVSHMPVTHVRFAIYPDGGVSRLRLWGTLTPAGRATQGLLWLNTLDDKEAEQALLACCGARSWARHMAARRPFADMAMLRQAAREVFDMLQPQDWLDAFAAHPRIGERPQGLGASARWSAEEQAGVAAEAEAFVAANREYEARFGHLFIACAAGKSAAELLAMLRARMSNSPEVELRVAAEEQRRITDLRLEKLVMQ
ncbi:MAG: allantoicase [Myxococcales bacterium]|nr:allantoicase [Myxococcota bacterium]MDW8283055.1 allantoicase [Myxococcales bacterium]